MVQVSEKWRSDLHRSRWDIMASILSAAIVGRTKTYIMRKCNLSYRQLQAYLDLLLDKGLLELRVEKGNPGKIFATTDKGRAFLKAYGGLKDTLRKGRSKFRLGRIRT